MVTGATGFVGRGVIRELLARGITPVCVVRSPEKLLAQHRPISPDRLASVIGSLADRRSLKAASRGCQAVIHLVGIIIERHLKGQTFERVHVRGTQNVVDAARAAGVARFVHMSALGTRAGARSAYHRTKWAAEEYVRGGGLAWTVFRPSLIHGPEGEFMRLMRKFMCDLSPPLIPYFGSGSARLQPVYVKDVAHCLVEALFRPDTIGKVFPLGGPRVYTWVSLYNACRARMPGAKHWKPLVSQPVAVAKAMATLLAPAMAVGELVIPSLGLLRFDRGQVDMSQEDAVCDHTLAEQAFGCRMRDFEEELAIYAEQIG